MKQILPTNFVDDIVSDSMNGKRRFNLIPNDDGTYSLEDVTEYDQLGSQFGSANINATNNAVNESADKNKILETLSEINATTEAGYMADALAVKELNNSLKTITYHDNEVLTITDERFTLGFAYADVRNDSCTLYVMLKVPNIALGQINEVAMLNEKFFPANNRFLPCTSWGGRAVASAGVLNTGIINFAMTTPADSAATTLDMYFETTYRLK